MKGLLAVILVMGGFLLTPNFCLSQGNFHENTQGGRKKEVGNQNTRGRGGLFKRHRSDGNADAFAANRSGGGSGFFYKLFHGSKRSESKNASLRKTRPGKVQDREQPGLFRRIVSPKKAGNESFLNRQRQERSKNRSRGRAFDK